MATRAEVAQEVRARFHTMYEEAGVLHVTGPTVKGSELARWIASNPHVVKYVLKHAKTFESPL